MANEEALPAAPGPQWSVIDSLPYAVVVIDTAGVVRHWNLAANPLLEGARVGAYVFDVLPFLRDTPIEPYLHAPTPQTRVSRFTARKSLRGASMNSEIILIPHGDRLIVEIREVPTALNVETESDARRLIQHLVEAGLALSSALSLDRVLQVLVNVARELVGARYAALGVLNAEGSGLAEFVSAGMTDHEHARIGQTPMGRGILGLLIKDPRPLRLRDLREHEASVGVPEHHPQMTSFLGVPVTAKGRVFGNLYVTDKIGRDEFSENDLALLETLAAQAAVAIENAQLRQERDRFFAAASHELGNAVAGIQVWARHLSKRLDDGPEWLEDGLGKISKGADSAHKLIDDLLSLARIQEGRLSLAPWPLDIAEAIHEAVTQQRPIAENAGLELIANVPDGLIVEADPSRVRQILVNLISNAIKFSTLGGRIDVGAQSVDTGDVVIFVRDQGPGVAARDIERIFQPYEQVSGLARGRGAGLGLPLSRQLARLMGGDLWVEQAVPTGSEFRLRLRQKMPPPRVPLEAKMFDPSENGRPRK